MTPHEIQCRELSRELLIHRVPDQIRRIIEAIRILSLDLGQVSASVREQRDLAEALQMDPGDCDRAIKEAVSLGMLQVIWGAGRWWFELLPNSKLWQRRKKRVLDDDAIQRGRAAWARLEAGALGEPGVQDLPGLIKNKGELMRDGGFGAAIAESNREAAVANAADIYKPGGLLAGVKSMVYGGDVNPGQSGPSRPAAQCEVQGGGVQLGNPQTPRPAGLPSRSQLGNSQLAGGNTRNGEPANWEIPVQLGNSQLSGQETPPEHPPDWEIPNHTGNSQLHGKFPITREIPTHDICHKKAPTELMSHEDGRSGAKSYENEAPSANVRQTLETDYERELFARVERLLMPTRLTVSFTNLWTDRIITDPQHVETAIADTAYSKQARRIRSSVGGCLNHSFLVSRGDIKPIRKFVKR